MQLLKQINPNSWVNIPQLRQFYEDLANKPYCANSKGFSHIRTKSHAVKHVYIQPNRPNVCRWLVFDIDDPQALFAYYDNDLPPPQVIIKNPENGHAHYAYKLTTPVGMGGNSSQKAMRYLASVQHALRLALGADKSYGGNLIKNPCHALHEVYLTGAKPSYELAELADYLILNSYKEPANDEGYGRNCTVFDCLRVFGYKHPSKDFNDLVRHLSPLADAFNSQFDTPLPLNELKHIVRSIARFCARTNFIESHNTFSDRQARRGAKGGKKSKRPSVATSEATIQPWKEMGISRATYYRRKKLENKNETG